MSMPIHQALEAAEYAIEQRNEQIRKLEDENARLDESVARLNETIGAMDQRVADVRAESERLRGLLKEIQSAYFGRCADDAPALAKAVQSIRAALGQHDNKHDNSAGEP